MDASSIDFSIESYLIFRKQIKNNEVNIKWPDSALDQKIGCIILKFLAKDLIKKYKFNKIIKNQIMTSWNSIYRKKLPRSYQRVTKLNINIETLDNIIYVF